MKKKEFNILLTSAGVATAVNVIGSLRNQEEFKIKIICVDNGSLSAGLYLADKFYLVPRINDPRYFDQLKQICLADKIDLIIPLYSKEIILFSLKKDEFEKLGVKVILSPAETIKLVDDKKSFYNFLLKENFQYPKTYDTNNLSNIKFPVFIKPHTGSGSKMSLKIESEKLLLSYLAFNNDFIVQDFIQGKEYTIDLLADFNSEVLNHVVRERIEVKAGQAIKCKTELDENISNLVKDLIKKLHIIGPANVQIIKTKEDKLFIIEVNPRFAAGGLPLSTKAGVNLPLMLVKLANGEDIPHVPYKQNLYMIRYLNEIYLEDDKLIS